MLAGLLQGVLLDQTPVSLFSVKGNSIILSVKSTPNMYIRKIIILIKTYKNDLNMVAASNTNLQNNNEELYHNVLCVS